VGTEGWVNLVARSPPGRLRMVTGEMCRRRRRRRRIDSPPFVRSF